MSDDLFTLAGMGEAAPRRVPHWPFVPTAAVVGRACRVLQIRGTNGAGKTTAVRRLLAWWGPSEQQPGWRLATGPRGTLAAIGTYADGVASGGVDTVRQPPHYAGNSMDAACDLIVDAVAAGHHVVFEGIIATSVHGRFMTLQRALLGAGHTMSVCFLAPPEAWAIENVRRRRAEKGTGGRDPAALDPTHLRAKIERVAVQQRYWRDANLPHFTPDYRDPGPAICRWFAGETP